MSLPCAASRTHHTLPVAHRVGPPPTRGCVAAAALSVTTTPAHTPKPYATPRMYSGCGESERRGHACRVGDCRHRNRGWHRTARKRRRLVLATLRAARRTRCSTASSIWAGGHGDQLTPKQADRQAAAAGWLEAMNTATRNVLGTHDVQRRADPKACRCQRAEGRPGGAHRVQQ